MSSSLGQPGTQEQFAALVGISQPAVSDLVASDVLKRGATLQEWLHAYCARLREQAAGRAGAGDLKLAEERALLAREQRIAAAMKNQVRARELAPVALLEAVLAKTCQQISSFLDSIPNELRQRSDRLTAEDLALVRSIVSTARNVAAAAQLTEEEIHGSVGDPASDSLRPEAA